MLMTYCKVVGGLVVERAVFDGPMPDAWPDRSLWVESAEAQIGWSYDGETFSSPPPSLPDQFIQSTPALIAMGQIKTADGDITQVNISAALAGAFLFDVGEVWVFLTEEQPDTDYIVLAYDANSVRAYVEDEDKFTGYFIIRVTDFTGTPTNPASLNFEVKRVI